MADLRISELPQLAGPALAAPDVVPLTDVSASQTKKIEVKDLIYYGIELLDPGSISQDKVDFTNIEIPDGSITAIKLADNSSGVVGDGLPAAGVRVGQIAVDTADRKLYVWNGTEWMHVRAAGSVNTIEGDDQGLVLITATQTDDVVELVSELADTTGPAEFLAGPTTTAGAITQRQIVGADLPAATDVDLGGVSVGSGLTIDAAGNISVENVTEEQTARSLATWDIHGAVTGGSPIEPNDLPLATESTPGIVQPYGSLTVDGTGILRIAPGTTPGTYTKVTVNGEGLVIQGSQIEADDILEVNADSIVGEIGSTQLAECAVEAPNICDYATCLIQEDNPGKGAFLGQFWYTPSTAQLRVYARGSGPENIWLPVGFGALQANNLRWGGTYDADTDTLVSLTSVGVAEGLNAGQPFPAATDQLSGIYFVCQVAGNSCSQPSLDNINHTAGDWALCLDEAQGWVHIDANNGGGAGGGGAQVLNDLLDVTIGGGASPFGGAGAQPAISLSADHILRYDGSSGIWRNTDIIDGGSID